MRSGQAFFHDRKAGVITETDAGTFSFTYDTEYLSWRKKKPISLTLPLQKEPFESNVLFPFFDGLIPEGWLLDMARKTWKLEQRDRMGLLLETCSDCIGAVRVEKLP